MKLSLQFIIAFISLLIIFNCKSLKDESPIEKEVENFTSVEIETLIEDKLASAINAMTEKQDELTAKVDESTKSVTDSIDEISTRVETVENSGAIKKSVDETDEEEDVAVKAAEESAPESFWGNLFLPQDLIKSLGYES